MALSNNEIMDVLVSLMDAEVRRMNTLRGNYSKEYVHGELDGILFMLDLMNLEKLGDWMSKHYLPMLEGK